MDFKTFLTQWHPFVEYRVSIRADTIAGGIPKHPDLIKGWIDATNKERSSEEREALVAATEGDVDGLSEAKAAKSWVCFKGDDKGLYLEGRCVKAMLKEAANIVKKVVPSRKTPKNKDGRGVARLKSKVGDHVFVVEEKVYFERDGAPLKVPSRTEERPIHVMTPQGERHSLKRSDYVDDVTMHFTVRRLDDDAVSEKALYAILAYGQNIGLGADRSQGKGVFEVLKVEREDGPVGEALRSAGVVDEPS